MTSAPLADAIGALTGEDALAFFDAIAPIVHRDSIDMSIAWFQSRYDKVGPGGTGADYINCPMTKQQYDGFVEALLAGEKTDFKEWETSTPYFDGCLPIEVMAERGRETLRHGPMKPVGLTNPHEPTVKAYAIVQLRQDNKLGTLYNMVGFQTKLKHGAQQRVFRTIPGLEQAEFARLGGLHRNTFLNSPKLLDRAIAAAGAAAAALRRPDDGLRGLCGIRRIGLIAGLYAAAEARAEVAGAAAGDDGARRAARPHHRRPYRNHRRRPALVPADEHQFRAVSAARQSTHPKARRHAACAATKRPSRRNRRSAPARWPISIDGLPTACISRRRRESFMSLPKDDAAVLSAQWTEGVLLKRDVFSTVERGRFRGESGEVDAVLRRLDQVPWWSYLPARHLFARERRALAMARDLHVGPELLWAGRQALVRGFIDGVALHLAKPVGDVAYFRSAKQALRKLHRAGICHNDLAKEQNWLRGSDGRAYLTDFQLAACFKTRSRLFRIAAYEDLRHLLKHKRSYAPDALTPKERKILARKSLVASVWLATGKKVYRAITRGLFNFTDREGGGRRLVNDAPVLIDLIRRNPAVRDTAIVAFADRRTGVGLYAFVEADRTALEAQLRDELTAAKGPKPPEHIQVVQALPRDSAGKPRTEILQLVAMNQLDLIEPMMTSDTDRAFLKNILESRKNLRDRFNFEAET